MVSILDFLPIITILAVGAGIWYLLSRLTSSTLRKTEYFNVILLIGSSILIIPLTWIGIQPDGILSISVFQVSLLEIDFYSWCLIYYLLGLVITIVLGYLILKKNLPKLEDFRLEAFSQLKDIKIILVLFLLIDYLILELLLPLRGFDALYYYFPETEVFFQTQRITEANYLSFLPVVKSPFNVLLFLYIYFTTNSMLIQLIPFLFLVGLVFLVYDFCIELFDNKSIAMIASIFILTLPFTYWLMNYWAFYQDLYLAYFFSVSCYFSLKWYKNPSNHIFGLLLGLGIILSLLSKINAWTLPIILILWLPSNKPLKIIRILIIVLLGIFLSIQASTRIYFGTILPIGFALIAAIYLILREDNTGNTSQSYFQLIPISIGTIMGSFWLTNRMSLSDAVGKEIYNLYFFIDRNIIWNYPLQSSDPLMHTLERMHGVNFISAMGILLLGTVFVLPWIFLKISAIMSYRKITAPLIWVLVFFAIWSTYYLNGSIRYLTPIIIPMIICISWGFHRIAHNLQNQVTKDILLVITAFLGCFSFYYLPSLGSFSITDQTQESVGLSYNQSAYDYYSNPQILILLAIGISLLYLLFIKRDSIRPIIQFNYYSSFKWIQRILIMAIILIPIVIQSYILIYTQGDIAQFQAIHEYEYRDEYQQIVTVIQQQNQPFAAIMAVRTPGLQFFTKQPVIDIYYQQTVFPNDPFFTLTNISEIVEILYNPLNYIPEIENVINVTFSLSYIVVPNIYNIYYSSYQTEIVSKSILFQSLDSSQYFSLIYENSDFQLFEVIFEQEGMIAPCL